MIQQEPRFYLDAAKQNPKNKQWVKICLRNYARAVKKKRAAEATAARWTTYENNYK